MHFNSLTISVTISRRLLRRVEARQAMTGHGFLNIVRAALTINHSCHQCHDVHPV
jgi:hypothetical protein